MTDIRQPNTILNPTTPGSNSSPLRLMAAALLVVLLIGAAVVAWIFLRSSRTIELAEKGSVQFKNYTITIDSMSRNICPSEGPTDCEDSKKQHSVQLRIQRSGDTAVSYQYLTLPSHPRVQTLGLELQLLSIDTAKKSAQLKLTRK